MGNDSLLDPLQKILLECILFSKKIAGHAYQIVLFFPSTGTPPLYTEGGIFDPTVTNPISLEKSWSKVEKKISPPIHPCIDPCIDLCFELENEIRDRWVKNSTLCISIKHTPTTKHISNPSVKHATINQTHRNTARHWRGD